MLDPIVEDFAAVNSIRAIPSSQCRITIFVISDGHRRRYAASLKTPLNDKAMRIVNMIHGSVDRIAALIDNVLDFARGRLGGGLSLDREAAEPVEPILRQAVSESRQPDRSRRSKPILNSQQP